MSNATYRVENREPVTYVALPVTVTMHDIGERIGAAYTQLDVYLAARGINPSGPSLVRYRKLDMRGPFTIEVGWVIPENTWIDLPYVADVLPAGRYAVGSFEGPYAHLEEVTRETLMWADLKDLNFDVEPGVDGKWASRVELYLDDPREGEEGLEGPVEVAILTLE
ncbi:GyrI-like domain-containing protein [Demequina oxidasica]|uniref:GyrI-like domain-containing protein n=1 Tax=Demequina oxidasica TaxID=676199 RepID=UPI0007807360|nr:GyrI-like domain-containing protein [Demequina oxidasica]